MKKTAFFITIIMLFFALFHIFVLHDNGEFVEGDLYDEIMSRGKIKIGVSSESKPFAYTNEKGELVGYDVDLAKYIAQYIVKNRMLTDSPQTLDDIGNKFNISRERVRQIEKRAFEKLSAEVKLSLSGAA